MRLELKSRTGCFNFCNPEEETTRTTVRIFDENNNILKFVSIETEYNEDGDDVEQAIYLIEEQDKKVLYATDQKEWKEMVEFLKEHQEEIEKGNKEYRIQLLKKQIEKLTQELTTLTT